VNAKINGAKSDGDRDTIDAYCMCIAAKVCGLSSTNGEVENARPAA